jgi:hypothetical protein
MRWDRSGGKGPIDPDDPGLGRTAIEFCPLSAALRIQEPTFRK